jgi:hypothetical protein
MAEHREEEGAVMQVKVDQVHKVAAAMVVVMVGLLPEMPLLPRHQVEEVELGNGAAAEVEVVVQFDLLFRRVTFMSMEVLMPTANLRGLQVSRLMCH